MHIIESDATSTTPAPASRRRRGRRAGIVAVAALATVGVAAGAAAAGGLFSETARTTPSLSCAESADLNGMVVIGSSSGDPITDCSAWWRAEKGDPVPPMAVFQHEGGGVLVVPQAVGTPEGVRPLPPGFRQDVAIIQLNHELDDRARGIGNDVPRCRTIDDAEALVRAQLDRLGLTGWQVDRPRDGDARCAGVLVEAGERRVVLDETDPASPLPETMAPAMSSGDAGIDATTARWDRVYARNKGLVDVNLSRGLADAMISGPGARCLSDAAATDVLKRVAAEVGGPDDLTGLMTVKRGYGAADAPDGERTCVRPSVLAGGTMLVYLDAVPAPVPHR